MFVSAALGLVAGRGLSLAVARGHCSLAASHCSGFSRPGGVIAEAHGLSCPRHVGSSQIRDQTHVSCIGRQILNHWTTREVPNNEFLSLKVILRGSEKISDPVSALKDVSG